MSHSPLLEFNEAPADVEKAVKDAFSQARAFVADYDPELVVVFEPDHYNGFFYDIMPPFCIGFDALAVGDYGTERPLDVPGAIAEVLAQHVADAGLHPAISRRMELDHGAVHPLEILLGDIAGRPLCRSSSRSSRRTVFTVSGVPSVKCDSSRTDSDLAHRFGWPLTRPTRASMVYSRRRLKGSASFWTKPNP